MRKYVSFIFSPVVELPYAKISIMNTSNKLLKIGIAIGALGLLTLVFNFFNMYNLVGGCPDGGNFCKAYTMWHFLNWIGTGLLLAGLISAAVSFLQGVRNK